MTLHISKCTFTEHIKVKVDYVYKYEVIVISDKIYKLLSTHDFSYSNKLWANTDIISLSEYRKRFSYLIRSENNAIFVIHGSKQLIAKIKLIL